MSEVTELPRRDWCQLNASLVFVNIQKYQNKPHLAVAVAIPDSVDGQAILVGEDGRIMPPAGYALRWMTELSHQTDATFGDEGTGVWTLVVDNSKTKFYETADGAEYTPAVDKAYDGYGAVPSWLTIIPRPSALHTWVDGAWYADPAALEQKAYDDAKALVDAKVASESARASAKIAPLQDAVELGIATEQETTDYNAWRAYRVFISRVPTQTAYPLAVDWPAAPDATPPA